MAEETIEELEKGIIEKPENGDAVINSDVQFELAAKIAKAADQAFMNTSQLTEILEGLCGRKSGGLDMSGDDREVSIFAITQLMELIRQLPMKFFTEIDNREHILEAMQAQLDELIIAEELEETETVGNVMVEEEAPPVTADNVIKNA